MSTEHEYDTQQMRTMLDRPSHEDASDIVPTQFHEGYQPQFDEQHMRAPTGEYYDEAFGRSPVRRRFQASDQLSEPHLDQLGGMIDLDDPMLDADPFGLTASMHLPTAYSFDAPPQR